MRLTNFEQSKHIIPETKHFQSMIIELVEINARGHNPCNENLSCNVPKIGFNIAKRFSIYIILNF